MKIKKQKAQKSVSYKENLNLEIKIDVDNLKENHKELTKNNKLILKTQQRFRSENHNVFTEEINKIALISNDEKRI